MQFDVVILGAGAAGMMCAATAAQRGRRVLLVDHASKLAEKIRISGGGRCNFTNLHASPDNYLSENPHFCRSALARYTPQHFLTLLHRHQIGFHEKKLGQLFCNEESGQIIRMLQAECDRGGVVWRMQTVVDAVERHDDGFLIRTSSEIFQCSSLVIATGGLSIPKIGATPFAYQLAEQFGLKVIPPRPGLVPLMWNGTDKERFADLAGVSHEVVAQAEQGPLFRENLLFTHGGLSGPAILQVSSYWQPGQAIRLNLLPDQDAIDWLLSHRREKLLLSSLLAQCLPRRLAERWCADRNSDRPVNQLGEKLLRGIGQELNLWIIRPGGTAGYRKAEVTVGGIDTRELSSKTMEARRAPGLYAIGESVDVTGWLGGYNFQWAWASAVAAGLAA